jgi:hypothetical protein
MCWPQAVHHDLTLPDITVTLMSCAYHIAGGEGAVSSRGSSAAQHEEVFLHVVANVDVSRFFFF